MNVFSKPLPYLDPGSGSMLIQMILAAVLGLGVAVRVFWKQIKGWFTKKKTSEDASYDPTEIVDDPTVITEDLTTISANTTVIATTETKIPEDTQGSDLL